MLKYIKIFNNSKQLCLWQFLMFLKLNNFLRYNKSNFKFHRSIWKSKSRMTKKDNFTKNIFSSTVF